MAIHPTDLDLVFLWSDTSGSSYTGGLHARKAGRNAPFWSIAGGAGAEKTGPLLVLSGTDGGYSLKHEPITDLQYDATNDHFWYGYTAWIGDASNQGDGWLVGYLTNVGASGALAFNTSPSPIQVYAAGTTNSHSDQFVTGDVHWDTATQSLFVTYTNLLNHDVLGVLLDASGSVLAGPATLYSSTPFDIPVIEVVSGDYKVIGRDFNCGAGSSSPTFSGGPYTGIEISVPIV
jgi:hypothetical protein